jgi:OOP family OmpA-OmpF porin
MYIAPMAGYIFYFDEPNIDDLAIMGGRIGYFITDRISMEGSFEYNFSEFKGGPAPAYDGLNANHYFILVNGRYHFGPVLSKNLSPYILAGIGGSIIDTGIFGFDDGGFAGNYGAGVEYKLSDNFLLRSDVRHLLTTSPSESDLILSAGISMNFGGEKPSPKPLPPPPPPPPVVQKDSDGDGVVDNIDKCPNTPRGCVVDALGCPLDGDMDGICDGIDQCSDTPPGCVVDALGCPLDGDIDGICDGIDQCPNTPKGVIRLDEKGCSPMSSVGIHFDSNTALILPRSYPDLDKVVTFLKDNPTLVMEIQGHTDSYGTTDYNQTLSEKRAEAVRDYFISKGVPASQMTTKGYGMSKPIADNTTNEGTAMNRRIEYWLVP